MFERFRRSSERDDSNSEENQRTVFINDEHQNSIQRFASNKVTTAKYEIWSFLPKNLFEQFMRLANVYFLIISLLQQIPNVSPTGKWTTLGPFCVVLGITMVKEAFEDIKRHQQDSQLNNSRVKVLDRATKTWVPKKWRDCVVGDFVKLGEREAVPADVVLLSTSEKMGTCYIETSSLDGETSLKVRQALPETSEISEDALLLMTGKIKCEKPNNRLYHFDSSISLGDKTPLPLSTKQLLLRGSTVRNTKWAIGFVVYTGSESKLMKNANKSRIKRTNVEKFTNMFVAFIFAFELVISIFCAIMSSYKTEHMMSHWYLDIESKPDFLFGIKAFATYIILYNNLIPISLYVTVEIVKFWQAFLISNDMKMYHKETDTPALARTSNLNEELGQIEYVFTDKTGTLTENLMVFRKCTIGGILYGNTENPRKDPKNVHFLFDDSRLLENMRSSHATSEDIREFLILLAVCHTVIPERSNDEQNENLEVIRTDDNIVYMASSPDEEALVAAAKSFGFYFHTRTANSVIVNIDGVDEEYQILNVLEFNSTRKRMSVIVKTPSGQIKLYCKGADSVIYPRLIANCKYVKETMEHLEVLATDGLRTLCCAVVELAERDYNKWNVEFQQASISIVNRERELERVGEMIEKNMRLLGATAIEDKLQKGVPETIFTLLKAGIKVWMLTGDKQETAINIGISCSLLSDDMELIILNESTRDATIQAIDAAASRLQQEGYSNEEGIKLAAVKPATKPLGLVVDGATLVFALEPEIKLKFLNVGKLCKSVICCRVSPLQKAEVVKLVKDTLKITSLAIGDGANDVSMIQAAHVGVGISGVEGLQAARASDYSVAQFRYLQRLLLVHGRWNYRRISKIILYSFYKNIVLYLSQFWFTLNNGFSGQSYYERWTLGQFNVLFTFFPIIFYGILDQDVSESLVFQYPQLYDIGIKKNHFNIKVIFGWLLNAVYHSCLLYYIPTAMFSHNNPTSNGQTIGVYYMGTVAYTCIVLTVTLKLILETRYWTWLNALFVVLSVLCWFLFLMVYGVLWMELPKLNIGEDLYGDVFNIYKSPVFWFGIIIVPIICLSRDFLWKFLQRTYFPKSYHIVQEMEAKANPKKLSVIRKTSSEASFIYDRMSYTGYAFASEDILGQSKVVNHEPKLASLKSIKV